MACLSASGTKDDKEGRPPSSDGDDRDDYLSPVGRLQIPMLHLLLHCNIAGLQYFIIKWAEFIKRI